MRLPLHSAPCGENISRGYSKQEAMFCVTSVVALFPCPGQQPCLRSKYGNILFPACPAWREKVVAALMSATRPFKMATDKQPSCKLVPVSNAQGLTLSGAARLWKRLTVPCRLQPQPPLREESRI